MPICCHNISVVFLGYRLFSEENHVDQLVFPSLPKDVKKAKEAEMASGGKTVKHERSIVKVI
jgi:hypothetical protein